MGLPTSGPITISNIASEFASKISNTVPHRLNEYGGHGFPYPYPVAYGIPISGAISVGDFHGASDFIEGSQVFLGSGTFTPPSGTLSTTIFYVWLLGGGGGGGGAEGTGGGGGGGLNEVQVTGLTAGSNYSVTVGMHGVPGRGDCNGNQSGSPSGGPHGTSGGSSSFQGHTATGGGGGFGAPWTCGISNTGGSAGSPGGQAGGTNNGNNCGGDGGDGFPNFAVLPHSIPNGPSPGQTAGGGGVRCCGQPCNGGSATKFAGGGAGGGWSSGYGGYGAQGAVVIVWFLQ